MSVITNDAGSWIENYGVFGPGLPWGCEVHTLQAAARPGLAWSLSEPGGYLDNEGLGPQRMTDPTNIVSVLPRHLKGGHSGSIANQECIGYEVTGFAEWTAAEWLDGGLRQKALENDASIIAEDIEAMGWKREWIRALSIGQMQSNHQKKLAGRTDFEYGLHGHVDVSVAFPGTTSHWDPGPGFPWAWFLDRVRFYFDKIKGVPTPPKPPALAPIQYRPFPSVIKGKVYGPKGALKKNYPAGVDQVMTGYEGSKVGPGRRANIKLIQKALGIDNVIVQDGRYGPITAQAVKLFQKKTKCAKQTGFVGPKTWLALMKVLQGK